jgi:hypothetical protein
VGFLAPLLACACSSACDEAQERAFPFNKVQNITTPALWIEPEKD